MSWAAASRAYAPGRAAVRAVSVAASTAERRAMHDGVLSRGVVRGLAAGLGDAQARDGRDLLRCLYATPRTQPRHDY